MPLLTNCLKAELNLRYAPLLWTLLLTSGIRIWYFVELLKLFFEKKRALPNWSLRCLGVLESDHKMRLIYCTLYTVQDIMVCKLQFKQCLINQSQRWNISSCFYNFESRLKQVEGFGTILKCFNWS